MSSARLVERVFAMKQNDFFKIGAGFLTGWWLGRRRRSAGFSSLILIVSLMGLLMACSLTFLGVPLSLMRARRVRGLPQVTAQELPALEPGSKGLYSLRAPRQATADYQGMVLAIEDFRLLESQDEERSSTVGKWRPVDEKARTVELSATDGRQISLLLPLDVSYLEAQETLVIEEGRELRRRGYLPRQVVTVEGSWQGDDLLVARTVYGGPIDAYTVSASAAPAQALFTSLLCGLMSLVLLVAGSGLRVVETIV